MGHSGEQIIEWSKVSLEQGDRWEKLQLEYIKDITKAFPIPEQQVIYDWFITQQGEIPTTLEPKKKDRKPLTGEPLEQKYREYAMSNLWVFENFREYCEKVVLFWTNKQSFLKLEGEDDDYILGMFSKINSCPLPESKGLNRLEFNGHTYIAIKGIDKTPFTKSKLWNVVEGLSVRASKMTAFEQMAYFAAIFYWKKGERAQESKVEERAKMFMSLDVTTGLGVGFFLTSSINGLALNTLKSWRTTQNQTPKRRKRALTG